MMRPGDTDQPQLRDIPSAFGLLTRLPLPKLSQPPRGGAAAWAWPLVGATIGAIGALAAALALAIGLPPGVAAAAALAAQMLATGALHEDGLADTADGLFGGWTRERRLEIMKDSHIGSFGTLALLVVTLARWSAIATICAAHAPWAALIAAGAFSRVPMAVLMAAMPNARKSGLSQSVGRPSARLVALGALIALALSLRLLGLATLGVLALATLFCGLLALSAQRRIGGQTGDILGAAQQLAETATLAVAAATLK